MVVIAGAEDQKPVVTILVPVTSDLAAKAIAESGTPLSDAEKELIVQMLTLIADRTFDQAIYKEFWFSLIATESAFDQRQKSVVGAVGLGQLMPQFYKDLAASCGIAKLPPDTINDRYINATISACHFKHLIQETGGSVSLALVAYNAGINSPSFKRALKGGVPVEETAGYVTKVHVMKEKLAEPTK